jgi:hypothetical protein
MNSVSFLLQMDVVRKLTILDKKTITQVRFNSMSFTVYWKSRRAEVQKLMGPQAQEAG